MGQVPGLRPLGPAARPAPASCVPSVLPYARLSVRLRRSPAGSGPAGPRFAAAPVRRLRRWPSVSCAPTRISAGERRRRGRTGGGWFPGGRSVGRRARASVADRSGRVSRSGARSAGPSGGVAVGAVAVQEPAVPAAGGEGDGAGFVLEQPAGEVATGPARGTAARMASATRLKGRLQRLTFLTASRGPLYPRLWLRPREEAPAWPRSDLAAFAPDRASNRWSQTRES